jgi:hypothetical protein
LSFATTIASDADTSGDQIGIPPLLRSSFHVFELFAQGTLVIPFLSILLAILFCLQILSVSFWRLSGNYWTDYTPIHLFSTISDLGLEMIDERTTSSVLLSCFFFFLAFGTIGLMIFAVYYSSRFRRLPRMLIPVMAFICEIISGVAILPLARVICIFYHLIRNGQSDAANCALLTIGILAFASTCGVYLLGRIFLGQSIYYKIYASVCVNPFYPAMLSIVSAVLAILSTFLRFTRNGRFTFRVHFMLSSLQFVLSEQFASRTFHAFQRDSGSVSASPQCCRA